MRFFADFNNMPTEDEDPPRTDPEPLLPPKGWWGATIEGVEYRVSDQSEIPYLRIEMSLRSAHMLLPDQRRQFLILSLSDPAIWRLRQFLWRVFGIKPGGMVQIDTDKWIGTRLTVKIEHERYGGQLRARIGNFSHSEEH